MSIETATQRLNSVLGDLETKMARRLGALEADNERLREYCETLRHENQSLKAAAAKASAAVPVNGNGGIDPATLAAMTQQSNLYKTTLAQTLADIDSLISRVSSAA
jgi:hypothetical protein